MNHLHLCTQPTLLENDKKVAILSITKGDMIFWNPIWRKKIAKNKEFWMSQNETDFSSFKTVWIFYLCFSYKANIRSRVSLVVR